MSEKYNVAVPITVSAYAYVGRYNMKNKKVPSNLHDTDIITAFTKAKNTQSIKTKVSYQKKNQKEIRSYVHRIRLLVRISSAYHQLLAV